MGASEPAQVIDDFVKLFNSGDLDGLLRELYEDEAVLVPSPGTSVSGKTAMREVLHGFVAMGGTMSLVSATAIQNGDLALTHSKWRLEVPGGDPMEGTTAEVVRRQSDGSWKYVIDNPWGGSVLDSQ
jgi:ketosteroid isomerase-like protein